MAKRKQTKQKVLVQTRPEVKVIFGVFVAACMLMLSSFAMIFLPGLFGGSGSDFFSSGDGCVIPYSGMKITRDTTICSGEHRISADRTNGAAIYIVNSDVTLTCESGAKIVNSDGPSGYGLIAKANQFAMSNTLANVVVKVCVFENFTSGIYFENTVSSRIENNILLNLYGNSISGKNNRKLTIDGNVVGGETAHGINVSGGNGDIINNNIGCIQELSGRVLESKYNAIKNPSGDYNLSNNKCDPRSDGDGLCDRDCVSDNCIRQEDYLFLFSPLECCEGLNQVTDYSIPSSFTNFKNCCPDSEPCSLSGECVVVGTEAEGKVCNADGEWADVGIELPSDECCVSDDCSDEEICVSAGLSCNLSSGDGVGHCADCIGWNHGGSGGFIPSSDGIGYQPNSMNKKCCDGLQLSWDLWTIGDYMDLSRDPQFKCGQDGQCLQDGVWEDDGYEREDWGKKCSNGQWIDIGEEECLGHNTTSNNPDMNCCAGLEVREELYDFDENYACCNPNECMGDGGCYAEEGDNWGGNVCTGGEWVDVEEVCLLHEETSTDRTAVCCGDLELVLDHDTVSDNICCDASVGECGIEGECVANGESRELILGLVSQGERTCIDGEVVFERRGCYEEGEYTDTAGDGRCCGDMPSIYDHERGGMTHPICCSWENPCAEEGECKSVGFIGRGGLGICTNVGWTGTPKTLSVGQAIYADMPSEVICEGGLMPRYALSNYSNFPALVESDKSLYGCCPESSCFIDTDRERSIEGRQASCFSYEGAAGFYEGYLCSGGNWYSSISR